MESRYRYINNKSNIEKEESLLLNRLIALRKQLNDEEPKVHKTEYNIKDNINNNASKNGISTSKFKYRKVNDTFISTKIDNRNVMKYKNKTLYNNCFVKPNNLPSVEYNKSNLLDSTLLKNDINSKTVIINKTTDKYKLEINGIMKNSIVKNTNSLLNENNYTKDNFSQILGNVDQYILNINNYLMSSKYVINKEDKSILTTNQIDNHTKNVHVNRKFQNQLISNNLLKSNLKNASNSFLNINKKKPIKRLSGKLGESPNLIKIGNTKLIRRSLLRNKYKINNEQSTIKNESLSTLEHQTSSTSIMSSNKTKWTNISKPTPTSQSKLSNSNDTNKLKWTRPNILLVNNINKNSHSSSVPKSDKLILFGKNKIIRQSLISSIHSNSKKYLLKHLSHRFALKRKLQQKINILKPKNIPMNNEQAKNTMLLKKMVNKPVNIKMNEKSSYSVYSYVNPKLRSKINSNYSLEKTKCSDTAISGLLTTSYVKSDQNLKIINNDTNKMQYANLTRNITLERYRNKKLLTKQLCLVFNQFGICSSLDQGKCDKRHYKKFIALCTKFLNGDCSKENCTLSHNIVEEKIPFCKHYLNNICVKFNCPYLHEYRDPQTPICKNFLHGYCNLGKKCPKKHLNLCPIFDSKTPCTNIGFAIIYTFKTIISFLQIYTFNFMKIINTLESGMLHIINFIIHVWFI
ncbi:Hypothetical protein CINCED_3A016966 [Cinara cedri]|uniref:C3H1-type domain-containing protein n=1 Tax=Cinara cedri TaxID=506608 RepID=A0A5E4NG53_9HEMI|nr:Hypothetical protein CINCED_3A016966 [Cinara cedri]